MNAKLTIPKYMFDFFEKRSLANCYDKLYFPHLKVIYTPENEGRCICEMKILETHVNVNRVAHGGLVASLIDSVTTAALYSSKIRKTGVSVNMNISYVRPAKLNETVIIDGKVLNAGSKLAYLAASVYLKSPDLNEKSVLELLENIEKQKLVANGTHTKFIVD